MYISNCSGVNEIYRNTFSNLEYGIVTSMNNTSPFLRDRGLQLLCNIFTDNQQQILIKGTPGIATYQGSETLSAGNRFYPVCFGGNSEFYNNGSQINYFGESDPEYMPECNYNVNLFNGTHNTCPSKLTGGIVPIRSLAVLNDSITETETELFALVNGGDTEGLNQTVANAEEDEALKLRNYLLSESPNLSDTVMINSITVEDVLPAIMVKDILVENPSAAKSSNLQNALNNRQNPLPEYMRNEIYLGRDKKNVDPQTRETNTNQNVFIQIFFI